MFDISKIKFIKTDDDRIDLNGNNYSFVGLKKTELVGYDSEFWLPLGFDDFNTEGEYNAYGIKVKSSFEKVKAFFFKMYRTFQIYKERKHNQDIGKTKDRDGIFEAENGFSFVNEDNEQVVFYGKLNALDKILEGYDELRISSLEKKQVRSHEIDYSKIHRYMHQAIYLDADVIYLDEMNIAKNVLIQDSPPIIQLFCFIYTEIKKELEELDSVSDKAIELTEKFKDNYLQPDSSLFAEDTFADTINILKNVFEEIDSKTTYKDEDFWHFYEAIEAFLMGERLEDDKGVYFGINNFYDIWEDMCQSYMLNPANNYLPKVLFADVNGKLLTRKDLGLKAQLGVNPFKVEINSGFRERMLKPDLVISKSIITNQDDIFKSKKLRNLKQNSNGQSESAFDVPLVIYETIKQKNYALLQKYYKLLTVEDDKRDPSKKFKYMLASDYLIFQAEVQNWLNQLNNSWQTNISAWLINIKIIDYKYMRQSDYQMYNPDTIDDKGENKIKADIHKQLIYEWTVQKNFKNSETKSEFWIPYYPKSDSDELKVNLNITNNEFKNSQIQVIKINFKILQEHYVKP